MWSVGGVVTLKPAMRASTAGGGACGAANRPVVRPEDPMQEGAYMRA